MFSKSRKRKTECQNEMNLRYGKGRGCPEVLSQKLILGTGSVPVLFRWSCCHSCATHKRAWRMTSRYSSCVAMMERVLRMCLRFFDPKLAAVVERQNSCASGAAIVYLSLFHCARRTKRCSFLVYVGCIA